MPIIGHLKCGKKYLWVAPYAQYTLLGIGSDTVLENGLGLVQSYKTGLKGEAYTLPLCYNLIIAIVNVGSSTNVNS